MGLNISNHFTYTHIHTHTHGSMTTGDTEVYVFCQMHKTYELYGPTLNFSAVILVGEPDFGGGLKKWRVIFFHSVIRYSS